MGPHLQQLYTGFLMLHQSRFIRLKQEIRRTACRYGNDAPHLRGAGHAHLDVLLDNNIKLHFDTHDAKEIALGELADCDFYFKRSYLPSVVAAVPENQRGKVLPLGLNYRVLPDGPDRFSVARSIALEGLSGTTLSALKQALDYGNRLGFQPRLRDLQAQPDLDAAPTVLFMVAAYDPYDDPGRSQDKIDDRASINETRARCLRLLKRELGDRFCGGFSRTRYSLERYGDLVIPGDSTSQVNYLRTLKSHPICIATSGLHGSTGWKLAEYVAFAKAIVSEKLLYALPGHFERGRHYLEFTSERECLKAVVSLIENKALRHELMQNNAAYYQSHLRPDALVRNALLSALGTRTA